MPTARLKLGNVQASGDSELAGAAPLAINVLMDGRGAVRRRPGISAWSGFPSSIPEASSIAGICQFQGDLYYVNDARKVHRVIVASAADQPLSTSVLTTRLAGSGRPVFAETKYRLVITGGDVPQKVDAGATVAARLGGSPPPSSQMVMLSSRLISDDQTSSQNVGQFRLSGVGNGATGEEYWDALNYIEADARPDDIVALKENTNELYAFGETTLQVYYPDPNTVFAPGRTQNIGCLAAGSPIRRDNTWAWMATAGRFVTMEAGAAAEEISKPIAHTLDLMTSQSDCFGFRYNFDQFDCLVWAFPTDGRAFSYQDGAGWSQWQGWNSANGNYGPLGITCHYWWEQKNLHLVGLSTGQIAQFDTAAATDLGSPIKALVRTGFEDHGTDAYKSCEALYLTLERGQTSTPAQVLVSYRDGLGAFCPPIAVKLGTTGDNVITVRLGSMGTYRRRQWQFEMSDAAELVLASVEEVFSMEEQD